MTPDEVQPPENPLTSGNTGIQGVVDGAHEQARLTRHTKGIIAAVLLAVALATGASSAQASRPPRLTLGQAKAAISHDAGKLGQEIANKEERNDGWRIVFDGAWLTGCETYKRGGLCQVQWRYSDHVRCTATLGALPARPIRIISLTSARCTETSNSESDIAPSPNSSPGTDRHVGE